MLTLLVWQYVGKETRGRFLLNGCQWRRGFTMLNKQLFRGNSLSFNESTAYLLILNIFYTKQYIWIELFLQFTLKKCRFIREVTDFFVTGGIQLTALLIHSYGIRKRRLSDAQLWLKFNDCNQGLKTKKKFNRFTPSRIDILTFLFLRSSCIIMVPKPVNNVIFFSLPKIIIIIA